MWCTYFLLFSQSWNFFPFTFLLVIPVYYTDTIFLILAELTVQLYFRTKGIKISPWVCIAIVYLNIFHCRIFIHYILQLSLSGLARNQVSGQLSANLLYTPRSYSAPNMYRFYLYPYLCFLSFWFYKFAFTILNEVRR